ncbi:hypothetical protein [Silanimonas sp.]|jgi:hypothetical protein|uniref:hypothetical protein n=1 Tax=Silanimonas sp. TaxID=1929290 RepID=UPI0037C87CF6
MSATAPHTATSSSPAALLAIALLVVAAVFAAGVRGGFLFDDFPNLVDNPALRALSWATLGAQWHEVLFSSQASDFARPLAMASFMLDRLLFDWHPLGWKLHSLLWHLLNTVFVALLARRWLTLALPGRDHATAAVLLALAWATLPLQVSSVLYVVQRMELMAATAVLLGLLAYHRGRAGLNAGDARGWAWLVGAGGIALVGVGAKESAALFFAYVLVAEATLYRFDTANPRDARRLRGMAIAGALGALALAVGLAPAYFSSEAYAVRDYGAAERLLSQPGALWHYVGWVLLPRESTMVFYYDDWPMAQALAHPMGAMLPLLAGLVAVSAALALRRSQPGLAAGVLFFLAGHLITSSYLPLEPVFEHRNYLPAFGLLFAAVALLRQTPPAAARALPWALGAWLLLSAGQALLRAGHWGSPVRLAELHAERAPGSPRACYDRALLYTVASGFDPTHPAFVAADRELARCAALPRGSLLPAQAGVILHSRGGTGQVGLWWQKLEAGVRDPMFPASATALTTLARCRLEQTCPLDDASLRRVAERTAALRSAPSEVHRAMGDVHWRVFGDLDAAEAAYRRAFEVAGVDDAAPSMALAALLASRCSPEASAWLKQTATRDKRGALDGDLAVLAQTLSHCEPVPPDASKPSVGD